MNDDKEKCTIADDSAPNTGYYLVTITKASTGDYSAGTYDVIIGFNNQYDMTQYGFKSVDFKDYVSLKILTKQATTKKEFTETDIFPT